MPTSALGSPDHAKRAQRGFTLLELMVVVAVVAMATAGVSLALRDSSANALDREAARLSALLSAAHAQARTEGVPLQWRATAQGFVLGHTTHMWLAPGTRAHIDTPDAPGNRGGDTLVLGPEPMMAPQRLTLSLQGRQVTLATDGLRPFGLLATP
ncbi:MAG: prepilin-type N-terminal cleavage/methylation domain-containing protein [Burkholderiaceae bacterium]